MTPVSGLCRDPPLLFNVPEPKMQLGNVVGLLTELVSSLATVEAVGAS